MPNKSKVIVVGQFGLLNRISFQYNGTELKDNPQTIKFLTYCDPALDQDCAFTEQQEDFSQYTLPVL